MIETLIILYGYSVVYSIITQTVAAAIALVPIVRSLKGEGKIIYKNNTSLVPFIKNFAKSLLIPITNIFTGTLALGIMLHPKTRKLAYEKMYASSNLMDKPEDAEKRKLNDKKSKAKTIIYQDEFKKNNEKEIEDSLILEGLNKENIKSFLKEVRKKPTNKNKLNDATATVTAFLLLEDIENNISLTTQDKLDILKPLKEIIKKESKQKNTSKDELKLNKILSKKMQ